MQRALHALAISNLYYIFTMISIKEGEICQDEIDEMRYSRWDS